MKKFLAIAAILLIVQLSGCQRSEIYNVLGKIDFNEDMGLYCIDNYNESNSLILFAVENNLSKDEFKLLADLKMDVTLVSMDDEKIFVNSNNIEWKECDPNLLKSGLSLRLKLNNTKDLNDMVINKIVFTTNKKSIKIDINPIYLNIITSLDNGITVMEAPIAPKHKVEINKKYTFSYKILDQSGELKNDLKASVIYNENISKYIEIVNIEVLSDKNMENQILTEYKDKLDEEKLAKIKVYELRCDYIIHEKSNIVFQPHTLLHYSDQELDLIPFEPICFFMK